METDEAGVTEAVSMPEKRIACIEESRAVIHLFGMTHGSYQENFETGEINVDRIGSGMEEYCPF